MAQTIEQFLVSLGYQIDEGQQRRFTDYLTRAHARVMEFGKGLTGVLNQFEKMAGTASASAASIFAATVRISEGIAQIGGEAHRIGSTAEGIKSLEYAFKQVQLPAGQARAMIDQFAYAIQRNPNLARFFGLDPNGDPVKNFVALSGQIQQAMEAGGMQRAQMLARLQVAGIGPDVANAIANPEFRKAFEEESNRLKEMGGMHEQVATDIIRQINRIQAQFEAFGYFLFGQWGDDIDHALKRVSGFIDEWTPTVKSALTQLHNDIIGLFSGKMPTGQNAKQDAEIAGGGILGLWLARKIMGGALGGLLRLLGVPLATGGGGGSGLIGALLGGSTGLLKLLIRRFGIVGALGMFLTPSENIATDAQEHEAMTGGTGAAAPPAVPKEADTSVWGNIKTFITGKQAMKPDSAQPGGAYSDQSTILPHAEKQLWEQHLGPNSPMLRVLQDLHAEIHKSAFMGGALGGAQIVQASYTGGGYGGLIHRAAFSNARPDIGAASGDAAGAEGMLSSLERAAGLPAGILDRVWAQESNRSMGGNVVSSAGAMGPFQFMAATARRFGVNNPFDLRQAAGGAARYMQFLMQHFGGNISEALAGYNAGEGAVDNALKRFGGNWLQHMPAETQQYVTRILRGWQGGGMGMSPGFGGGARFVNVGETHITVNGVQDPNRAAQIIDKNMDRRDANMLRHLRTVAA